MIVAAFITSSVRVLEFVLVASLGPVIASQEAWITCDVPLRVTASALQQFDAADARRVGIGWDEFAARGLRKTAPYDRDCELAQVDAGARKLARGLRCFERDGRAAFGVSGCATMAMRAFAGAAELGERAEPHA